MPESVHQIENVWAGKASFSKPNLQIHRQFLQSEAKPLRTMWFFLRAGTWRKYIPPPKLSERVEGEEYSDVAQGKMLRKKEGEKRQQVYGPLCKFIWEWVLLSLPGWHKMLANESRWVNPLPGYAFQVRECCVCVCVYVCVSYLTGFAWQGVAEKEMADVAPDAASQVPDGEEGGRDSCPVSMFNAMFGEQCVVTPLFMQNIDSVIEFSM